MPLHYYLVEIENFLSLPTYMHDSPHIEMTMVTFYFCMEDCTDLGKNS